jgi:hypothetical protein
VTPEAEQMARIVAELAPLLKVADFKKRRHAFNRTASDGLVHVVNCWMAPKEPPAWTEVPGLRERLYGSFRLDFGVYVPEMTRTQQPRSTWINEYDCHLQRTAGQLLPEGPDDLWWRLADPASLSRARQALLEAGLPWLDQFPDREAVLDAFQKNGPDPLGMSPVAALDIADLYRAMERPADERRTLEQYVSRPVLRSHAPYLAEYLTRHGHDDLAERITTQDQRRR